MRKPPPTAPDQLQTVVSRSISQQTYFNIILIIILYKFSSVSEVLKKFDELENAMRTHLGNHQKKEKDPVLYVNAKKNFRICGVKKC
jgi:hypothetical protein